MLAQSFASFGRIPDPKLRAVQPLRIHTIVLERPSTIDALSKGGGVTVDAPTLARLNGVDPTTSLPEGWSVKMPVPGGLRG